MLSCEECEAVSAKALGWICKRVDVYDDDEPRFEPFVVFYCPLCAVREFGFVSNRGLPKS